MSLTFPLTRNPQPKTADQVASVLAEPGFGNFFTDHMAVATWTSEDGWADSRIQPYGPFQIDPAGAVLHYGQEIFEGLKAYRHADGSIDFLPLAMLFQDNPYQTLNPPKPGGGFHSQEEVLDV